MALQRKIWIEMCRKFSHLERKKRRMEDGYCKGRDVCISKVDDRKKVFFLFFQINKNSIWVPDIIDSILCPIRRIKQQTKKKNNNIVRKKKTQTQKTTQQSKPTFYQMFAHLTSSPLPLLLSFSSLHQFSARVDRGGSQGALSANIEKLQIIVFVWICMGIDILFFVIRIMVFLGKSEFC